MAWTISAAIFLGVIIFALGGAVLWSRRADIRTALKERRREKRIAAGMSVELSRADDPNIREPASTENLSRHGARVLTKMSWRRNERVVVRLLEKIEHSHARIAYCTPSHGDAFAIGLKFSSPVDTWNLDFLRSDHPFGK